MTVHHPRIGYQVVAVMLAMVLPTCRNSVAVGASLQSMAILRSGLEALGAGQSESAKEQFESAIKADPADSNAEFLLGVAFNRLSRPQEALRHLQRARSMGNTNDDMAFETGWSFIMLLDWKSAREQIEAYERDHPGRGLTSEFLGRTYLGLKDYAMAEAAFDRAVALDPELKPTVDLYRVQLATAHGGQAAGQDAAERLFVLAPFGGGVGLADGHGLGRRYGSADANASALAVPATLLAPAGRPVLLAASVATGYDTNARALQAATASIAAPNGADSAFAQLDLDVTWFLINLPKQRVLAGFELFDRTYVRQTIHSDFIDPEVYLELDEQLSKSLLASVRVLEDYTLVDYANFRTQVGAQAALDWDLTPGLQVELSYSCALNNYMFRTPLVPIAAGSPDSNPTPKDVLSQSGDTHGETAAIYWTWPGSEIKVRGGYTHDTEFTRGTDYDFESNGIFAGLTVPLSRGFIADMGYRHTLERYKNINSATVLGPAPARRRDVIRGVSVRLAKPLNPQLTAYIGCEYNTDRSNIAFYGYGQTVLSVGLHWCP